MSSREHLCGFKGAKRVLGIRIPWQSVARAEARGHGITQRPWRVRLEFPLLLALKTGKGFQSKECSSLEKLDKRTDSSLEHPEGTQPCLHPDFNPIKPIPDLQNRERRNVCHF